MNFKEFLKSNIVCLDGGMGTLLLEGGLKSGELPERLSITNPSLIEDIHRSYYDAGSNVVLTNTFGANSIKFDKDELSLIVRSAIECARRAKDTSKSKKEKFIALDIGPSGKLLKPYGDLDFEDAVSIFSEVARLGEKHGADLIFIETMSDSYEAKAALLAAREATNLPVIVSLAFGEDGTLLTGATPEAMVHMLEGLGADAIGANCSLGPRALSGVIKKMLECASVPVLIKPNAGLPEVISGKTVYNVSEEEFSEEILALVNAGVRIVGGCCGTRPSYIEALSNKIKGISPLPIQKKNITAVTSYTHAVNFGTRPLLIGERINPTGKKRFKEALIRKDMDYILNEAIAEQECGAEILDVNVGIPDIDECEMLTRTIREIQAVINLPLQIDTSSPRAMEAALRRYNGKALINSVSGKKESMDAIFPLAKKYGGVIIALTLDENGIPETADGRVEIAKRIIAEAEKYGIDKKELVFDTLTLTVSADSNAANVTLEALRRIKCELGCHTSLGVSNVSFGLPLRDSINSSFFVMAMQNGLGAAIMNPYSEEMMKAYYSYLALSGIDAGCKRYIENAPRYSKEPEVKKAEDKGTKTELQYAIIKGLADKAELLTGELLKDVSALDIINGEIVPALNTVGVGYENKTVYLPELLMSAEAAKRSFEVIKKENTKSSDKEGEKIILATVKGDIHDIGKNIVKLLLENYGFTVIDLGRDVSCEDILSATEREGATLVGLSALMTTTVGAMEEAIVRIKESFPSVKVMVGGAVLTEEYARKIGADAYAPDAMGAVRYAETLFGR